MARKSSISWLGVPSGRRAWMWIIAPPSSTIRRASAAYSSGVYGIAGHWSRFATAPEIAHVMITGSPIRGILADVELGRGRRRASLHPGGGGPDDGRRAPARRGGRGARGPDRCRGSVAGGAGCDGRGGARRGPRARRGPSGVHRRSPPLLL